MTLPHQLRPTRIVRPLFGMMTAAVLLATASNSFAGKKEIDALNAKLAPKTIGTATAAELRTAVVSFFTVNDAKLDPSIIAGEALKGATVADAGAQLAAGVAGATFPITFGTKSIADRATFAKIAIKTTGTGTGATVTQIPAFTQGLFNQTQAVDLAKLVKGTKGAAGAVVQGGAAQVADAAAAKAIYLKAALDTKELAALSQDLSKGVAATVGTGAGLIGTFTTDVITQVTAANKNLPKIITGIVAGKPTSAGEIADKAFTGQNSTSVIGKATGTIAKTVSAVADIEQIQKVGEAIAKNAIGVGGVKITTAKTIATTLAKAIGAKPFASLTGKVGAGDTVLAALVTTSASLAQNSEKADELGELAASFLKELVGTAQFTALKDDKTKAKFVVDFAKAIITNGKLADKTKGAVKPSKTDIAAYTELMGVYVAGSVAVAIRNSTLTTDLKNAIGAALKAVKGLAGKDKDGLVATAVDAGLAGTNGLRFESGVLGAVTDPETNTRNF